MVTAYPPLSEGPVQLKHVHRIAKTESQHFVHEDVVRRDGAAVQGEVKRTHKKTPTSSVFPLQNLHFKQVEQDLWGSFIAGQSMRKLQVLCPFEVPILGPP